MKTMSRTVLIVMTAIHVAAAQPVTGRTVTIAVPEPLRFVLALDEVELDLSAAADRTTGTLRTVTPVDGVREVRRDGLRATLTLAAASESDLLAVSRAAEHANPGTEAHLVLYPEGEPRHELTRHLLTREVAIILDRGVDLPPLLAQLGVDRVHAVAAVPNAWVIRAKEPLDSLRLADTAARISGVRVAYPLLRKKQQLR